MAPVKPEIDESDFRLHLDSASSRTARWILRRESLTETEYPSGVPVPLPLPNIRLVLYPSPGAVQFRLVAWENFIQCGPVLAHAPLVNPSNFYFLISLHPFKMIEH